MAATSEPAAPHAAVQSLSLYGGRTLAWSEYGDPKGTAVFYCHGFPGSRCEAALGDAAARELAVRLIAPDRPGFGRSAVQPGRSIADWPQDLARLAEYLSIERLRVLGVSGGGPYALACAALMPERLSGVSIVSGLGELTAPGTLRGMSLVCGGALGLSQRAPGLSRWLYGGLVGPALGRFPGAAVRLITRIGSPADARVLRDPPVRDVIEHSIGEAFRQGSAGPLQELGPITSAWGFDPAQIRVPVQLWHGERDRTVPATMGRHHVRLIPGCSARFLPNEGHFSLIVHHMRDITSALLAGD